jgi:hypothetical protein
MLRANLDLRGSRWNARDLHWSSRRPTLSVVRESCPLARIVNDLRQLAMGLLWLHRNGMDALTRQRVENDFDGGSIDPSGDRQATFAQEPVANYRAD